MVAASASAGLLPGAEAQKQPTAANQPRTVLVVRETRSGVLVPSDARLSRVAQARVHEFPALSGAPLHMQT